jgi:glycosyltransferase involved in cell wall biosynthesis
LSPHASSRLKILATANAVNSNIFDIRVGRPLRALAQQGVIELRSKSIYEVNDLDFLWADVLVLQRNVDARASRLISLCGRMGKVFIFEIDDLLIAPPPFLSIAKEPEEKRRAIRYALAEADVVSTTTSRLRDHLGVDSHKVILTPNYSEPHINPQQIHQTATIEAPTTLVLAASDRVLIDFITPSLKEVCDLLGGLVSLVVIGPLADDVSKHIPDIKKVDILPLDDFRRLLSSLPNPIGIIPLDNSTFSNCKSAVKFFDYALLGIPSICSDVPPYSDVVENRRTGLLTSNTQDDWSRCIGELATNAELRNEISTQARETVLRKHSFELNQAAWVNIMREARAISGKKVLTQRWMTHQILRVFLLAKAIFLDPIRITITRINRARVERRKIRRQKFHST